MHTWEMLKKERKGQRDLQKEKNSDSWRNTDTEKEKERKLKADRQRANKLIHKKAGRQAEWTDRQNVGRQTGNVVDRETDGRNRRQNKKESS